MKRPHLDNDDLAADDPANEARREFLARL